MFKHVIEALNSNSFVTIIETVTTPIWNKFSATILHIQEFIANNEFIVKNLKFSLPLNGVTCLESVATDFGSSRRRRNFHHRLTMWVLACVLLETHLRAWMIFIVHVRNQSGCMWFHLFRSNSQIYLWRRICNFFRCSISTKRWLTQIQLSYQLKWDLANRL